MGGLAIPKIPGVQVDLLKINSEAYSDPIQFNLELNEIMDKNIIKCLLVFITTGEYDEREEDFVVKMVDDTRNK